MIHLFDPVYLQSLVYASIDVFIYVFYLAWVIPLLILLKTLFLGPVLLLSKNSKD